MLYIIVILVILVVVTLYIKFFRKPQKLTTDNFTSNNIEALTTEQYPMSENLKNGIYNSGFRIYSKEGSNLVKYADPRAVNFTDPKMLFIYLDSFLNIYFPQIDIDSIRQFILMEKFIDSEYIDNISEFIQLDLERGNAMKVDVSAQIKITNTLLTHEFKFFIFNYESDGGKTMTENYEDRKKYIEGAIRNINNYKTRYRTLRMHKNEDLYYTEYNYTSLEIIKASILMTSLEDYDLDMNTTDVYQ